MQFFCFLYQRQRAAVGNLFWLRARMTHPDQRQEGRHQAPAATAVHPPQMHKERACRTRPLPLIAAKAPHLQAGSQGSTGQIQHLAHRLSIPFIAGWGLRYGTVQVGRGLYHTICGMSSLTNQGIHALYSTSASPPPTGAWKREETAGMVSSIRNPLL